MQTFNQKVLTVARQDKDKVQLVKEDPNLHRLMVNILPSSKIGNTQRQQTIGALFHARIICKLKWMIKDIARLAKQ